MSGHPDPALFRADGARSDAARRAAIEHALACAECRARLVAGGAERLFALLAAEPLPAERLERLSARIDRALDAEPARGGTRWSVALGAVAALLVATAFLPFVSERVAPRIALVPAPAAIERSGLPAGVELLDSPGQADLVEFAVGEIQVVMIFDGEMEI